MSSEATTGSALRRRIATIAGWTVAGALALVTLNRVVAPETVPLLVGVQGVSLWLLVPAYPLAGLALWRRRRTLAAVAAGLCVVQATLTVQAWGGTADAVLPPGAQPITLVTANVLLDNPSIDTVAASLATTGADLIVLQEMTPAHVARLRETPLYDAYPERVLDPREGYNGSVILSRWPLTGGGSIDVSGVPMAAATVHTPAGAFRLVNVHLVAPVNEGNLPYWRAQYAEMAGWYTGEPLVLAGDFNATQDHGPFRRLLTSGLRDAFDEAGSGLGATWPQWSGPVFPLMRLDHVLVSERFTVLGVQEQHNPGSDHRRLLVRLALPGSS